MNEHVLGVMEGTHPEPGAGALAVDRVDGASAAVACVSASPLRLLLPRPRGRTAWAIAASHGGGLVAGDTVTLEVDVRTGAQACLTTQAETKVYRGAAGAGRHRLSARIHPGALLALLPEPVSAYADSSYEQRQFFDLAKGASLVLVDSLAAGRSARGERWAFRSVATMNEIAVEGRVLLADALRLAAAEGPPVAERMRDFDLLATVVLLGPALATASATILADLAARTATLSPVLIAASPLGDGIHLRLAARTVEAGHAALRTTLAFLPALLAEDPLNRRP